jgi:hypothetical protein
MSFLFYTYINCALVFPFTTRNLLFCGGFGRHLRRFPTAATSYSDGFTKVIVLGIGSIYSDRFSNCRTNRCNYYSVGYKPSQSEKRKINYFTLSRRFETAAIVCFDIASVSNRRYPFFLVFFL